MKDKLNYVDWILLRFPLSGNTGIWNAPFISWGTYLTLIEWSYILQHYRWHSTASLKHPASCSPHSTFILQQADEDRYQLFRKTCLLPLRTVTLLQTYSCDLNWMAVEKESYFAITVKRLWQFLRDFWMKDLGYSDIYNTVHRIRMCSEKKKNYPDDRTGPLQKSEVSQLETIHWTWLLVSGRRQGGSELCLVYKVPSSRSVHIPLQDVPNYPTGIMRFL